MEPLTLVLVAIACLAAVASAWFARKNNVRELRSDVSEMLDAVDKMARDVRAAKMQRVRATPRDPAAPPPEFQGPAQEIRPSSPQEVKQALRQKVFARGPH